MRNFFTIIFLGFLLHINGQAVSQNPERLPIFPGCEGKSGSDLQYCFDEHVQDFVHDNFKMPESIAADFRGTIMVLFEVTDEGKFSVIYVDSPDEKLSEETRRVFGQFPQIGPPAYNGNPTYAKYTIKIAVPLRSSQERQADAVAQQTAQREREVGNYTKEEKAALIRRWDKELAEYDSIKYYKFNEPKFDSHLNIPFSHSLYAHFDAEMNMVGANNHTAVKPYNYAEVSKYFDLRAENQRLMKNKTGWSGRKLWNENTVQIQGEGYWFTMNPIFDLELGKSNPSVTDFTYLNTRGIQINGGLGTSIDFTTTIYETQGRFADYYNRYSRSIRPAGGNPAVVPGIGIVKDFKSDSFDLPLAEANLTFTASKAINIQLGYGRNFIGDGYRSLITTDGVSPYPFLKINTSFWKIKYTNTYMFLKDVRDQVTNNGTYATKYMANHYLSWNAAKRLNIGLFESVVWANTNGRGFDFSFVNPIIFYRSVEFASSAKAGNALLGITTKYKFTNRFNFYGQLLIDEFSFNDIKSGNQSWKNKFAYQAGLKYYHAFNVPNLLLQLEYNHIRPYVYSHSDPLTNYGNTNQSLGHQWGGNAREGILIARYHTGRYFADAKFTAGVRGFDFNTPADSLNYGGNIYRDYDESRAKNTGVKVGQGNKTKIFIADVQVGYLINPSTNLKLYLSYIYRTADPLLNTEAVFKEDTNWFSIGLRSDIFNWYYDY